MSEKIFPKQIVDEYGLGFVYKKCRIHKATLNGLMLVPEFRDALLKCVKENITITNKVVCEIIENLYAEWHNKRYSKEYKQNYVKQYGIDLWKNVFMKHYRHIADGYHETTKKC